MLALSLDMGGTHIVCGVVQDHELLPSPSLSSELAQSLASLLPCVTAELKKIMKDSERNACGVSRH